MDFMHFIALVIIIVLVTIIIALLLCYNTQTNDTNIVVTQQPKILQDPLLSYDYATMYNPLKEPVRRLDRYEIPSMLPIDYPTRGFPDNYTQIGTLINEKEDHTNNNVLRLFGRKTYPGSDFYEYYTMINNGLDQIKIPIYYKKTKELYDGDKVYIRELHSHYVVHIFSYDQPKYYP